MRSIVFVIVFIYAVTGQISFHPDLVCAANNEQGQSRPAREGVASNTNIHYSKNYCMECHDPLPAKGEKHLKYGGDYRGLCNCHHDNIGRDLHPVGIVPSDEIKPNIPNSFPLQEGKIDCITCHDIFAQCRDSKNEVTTTGQMFLRGAPYRELSQLCFKCHNKVKFEKYNPHKQLNEKGEMVELKCLYCHLAVPDVTQAEFKDITVIGDLVMLCDRCHTKADEQSLHARHLRTPSVKVFTRIKQMEVEFGIVLPLSDEGRITCVTCHNPHQKGVIPVKRAGAQGADAEHRFRLLGNMCTQCHKM